MRLFRVLVVDALAPSTYVALNVAGAVLSRHGLNQQTENCNAGVAAAAFPDHASISLGALAQPDNMTATAVTAAIVLFMIKSPK